MTTEQGDIVAVTYSGDIDSVDDVVMSFQGRLTSALGLDEDEVLADWSTIFSDLWDLIESLFNVLVVYRRVRAHNMTQDILLGESTFGTPRVGTALGDSLPNQVTIPVTFKTVVPRVMLRKLWGPAGEGHVDSDGTYGSGVLTNALAGGAFLLDPLVGTNGTWEYGYLSPKTLNFEIPISVLVTNVPGTLRKRRRGSGS
jgi:hypothetical protein